MQVVVVQLNLSVVWFYLSTTEALLSYHMHNSLQPKFRFKNCYFLPKWMIGVTGAFDVSEYL